MMTAAAQHLRVQFRPSHFACLPLALALAAVAAPGLLTHGLAALAVALSRGFALICHQHPERSLWIFGAPVAVCARCLGIYAGATAGLMMRTSRMVAVRLLIVMTALNVLDALAEVAGLHGNWMAARFALGVALGAAAGMLLSSAMAEEKAVMSLRKRFSRSRS